jgi:hypothetical protein
MKVGAARRICQVFALLVLLFGTATQVFAQDPAVVPPLPSEAPRSPPAQEADPESPAPPPRATVTATAPQARTNEAALIAGEVALSTLTLSAIGVAGAYALVYHPPQGNMPLPPSTAASTTLNLVGLAALLAGPLIAAKLVCGVGRWSADYEGGCGLSIGLAYGVGGVAASVADGVTTHRPPATCNECANTGPSAPAMLIAYVAGATIGAVVGWNLSKHRKDGSQAWLQPIYRAGSPPLGISQRLEWTPVVAQVPLLAFAF